MNRSPMDDLRAYAASITTSVSETETETAVTAAMRTPRASQSWLRHRVVTIGVSVATFFSANLGLAAAAQNAAPGDLLYGVDRAYERLAGFVGISDARTEERIQEASTLADRGDAIAAVEAASAALDALSSSLDRSEPGNNDLADTVDDGRSALADLPPAAEVAEPEFVRDVLAETRLLLELIEEVRFAAQEGEPGDASEAARQLAEQARKVADAAKDNPGQGKQPEEPGNPTP